MSPDKNTPEEKIFFFDNHSIELVQDLKRTVEIPNKHKNPIISKDKSWERLPYIANSVWTIIKDSQTGEFHCWYEDWDINPIGLVGSKADIHDPSVSRSRLCYAKSKDGFKWLKPELNLFLNKGKKTNIVLGPSFDNDNDFGSIHCPSVLEDPLEKNPSKKFKMIFQHILPNDRDEFLTQDNAGRFENLSSPMRLAFSPDGINWEIDPQNLNFGGLGPKLGDVVVISFDPKFGRYVLNTRHPDAWKIDYGNFYPDNKNWSIPYFPNNLAQNNKRRIFRTYSYDLFNWTELTEILAADSQDDNLDDSFYPMSSWMISSTSTKSSLHPSRELDLYVGLANVFHQVDNTLDVHLVFSRDGHKWNRTNKRQPFLANGPSESWDQYQVAVPSTPITKENKTLIFYGGSNTHHDWWITGPRENLDIPEAKDTSLVSHGIGIAEIDYDRYICLEPNKLREGILVTKPLQTANKHLVINGKCNKDGFISIELLKETGEILTGFGKTDGEVFQGNSIDHEYQWLNSNKQTLPNWVILRIILKDSKLYTLKWV
mgnify:FL=1